MEEHDMNDIRRVLADRQRAPRDIVPRTPDTTPIPTGTQTVVWHELTEDGITSFTEQVEICSPIERIDE